MIEVGKVKGKLIVILRSFLFGNLYCMSIYVIKKLKIVFKIYVRFVIEKVI